MAFVVIRLIYVDFRMCRTKERVQGTKMGWAIAISSLGSRHCSGVVIGGNVACTTGALASTTERAFLGRLVVIGEFLVATEMARPVSRQRI